MENSMTGSAFEALSSSDVALGGGYYPPDMADSQEQVNVNMNLEDPHANNNNNNAHKPPLQPQQRQSIPIPGDRKAMTSMQSSNGSNRGFPVQLTDSGAF